jgi:hypothetical protein
MIEGVEEKEKPGACVACGNSPTNHRITYFLNTTTIGVAPIMYPFLRTRLAQLISYVGSYAQHYLAFMYYGYSKVLGIIRYNATDKSKCVTYRSQVIWDEAERRGIRMEQVKIYGKHVETYRAFLAERTIYFDSLPIPPHLAALFYLEQRPRTGGSCAHSQ